MSEIDYGRVTNKINIARIDSAQEKPSRCFDVAVKEVLLNHEQHPEATMVTGLLPNSYLGKERIHHAWCELRGTVIYEDDDGKKIDKEDWIIVDFTQPDPNSRFIPAGLFYEQVKPTNVRRYTYEEMMAEIDNPRDWPV